MICMNTPQPPTAAIEATQRLLEPVSHPVPCDAATAASIADELGYQCNEEWIRYGQDCGFLPTPESWDYEELTVLLCSLEFRSRWKPGSFDERKNQARLALERQDLTLVSSELNAVLQYDTEFLLCLLLKGGLSETERFAVCETLRFRMLQVWEPAE